MAKGYVSYKDKYNTKYGYTKGKSHSLEEISKDTGVSMKGLQQIYNKGIGAYKTNPQSVRPNVKSKEQWAMARVYSAVMGGKASNIDSAELKMEKGGLIAPNGKKSNLTPLQYKLVRTPEFKAWFGDWENDPANSSKVVDENGEPLVVYHGSKSFDINEFDLSKSKRKSSGLKEFGTYFTDNPNLAKAYKNWGELTEDEELDINIQIYKWEKILDESRNNRDYQNAQEQIERLEESKKGKIYGVFLNLKKIYVFNAKGEVNIEAWNNLEVKASYKWATNRDAMEFLKEGKFGVEKVDGIKAENIVDAFVQTEELKKELLSNVYLVFDSKNIKLADGTNTTFDGSNPDIRFDDGGQVKDMISQGIIELKMFDTTSEHAKLYGFNSVNPLYIQSINIIESERLKGNGNQVLKYIDEYAIENAHDVIFGHITQKSTPSIDVIKTMLRKHGYSTIEGNNDFYKYVDSKVRYAEGGNVGQEITCQNCGWHWNTKDSADFDKYVCHKCDFDNSPFYSKGGMALDTQTGNNWYSKGGMQRKFAEGGKITQFEIEAMRNYINGRNPNPKLKDSFEKVLRKFGVEGERSDLSDFPKGKYVNTYDFSGYEYMRKINEEAGVFFLLTGEYQLVSKAIYEKDYSMWLFYSYLGRINISFKACQEWLNQAKEYFEHTMPIPIWLIHTPRATDGRSFAGWIAVSEDNKEQAESRIGRPLTFEYNRTYYYNEIGMVGNFDNNQDGWGSLYREQKTGLLVPEYTETSFHFNTLIHEFAHCLDFQSQLVNNIGKFQEKNDKDEVYINTEEMSDAELALYCKQLKQEEQKGENVAKPITNHFDEFVDSLIRVLRACAGGNIPLTQLYEQQAIDVQQALAGKYGDLLLEQREKRAKETKDLAKEDEIRDNKRFTWQSSWVNDIKEYAYQYSLSSDLKEKLKSNSKYSLTLIEALELDNLITGYFNTEFKKYMLKNPSKATQRLEDIKSLKMETNRIINNHYDNVKSNYQYGFNPETELELYIRQNCDIRNFRDYKSWKECAKEKLQAFV